MYVSVSLARTALWDLVWQDAENVNIVLIAFPRMCWTSYHLYINESSNDMIWQNSSRDWGSPSDVIYVGQHVYNYTENWMKVFWNTIK